MKNIRSSYLFIELSDNDANVVIGRVAKVVSVEEDATVVTKKRRY